MIKIFCDKCGDEIKANDKSYFVSVVSECPNTDKKTNEMQELEVCPECYLKIKTYLQGRIV